MTPNPFAWSFRGQYLTGFLVCAALLGFALYVQYGMLMMPCALCILQRIAFAAMGGVFLIGGLHSPKTPWGRKLYGVMVFIAASAGAGVAAKHLWLQGLPPDQVPLCTGFGLDYLVESQGVLNALKLVLQGSGDCAKIDWTFLGLSMPFWTLVWFLALGAGGLWAAWRRR